MNEIKLHSPEQEDTVIRALPHTVGAEKSVLSIIMKDPNEFLNLAIEEGINEKHFYLPQNAVLYEVLLAIHAEGKEIELVSLVQILLDKGKLNAVGGPGYVTEIYGYSPSYGHFHSHLKILKDKFFILQFILEL